MIHKVVASDFNFIYSLYMHPKVNTFLFYELMDAGSFQPIYNQLLVQQVMYIYCDDEQNTGMFKLIPFQHRSNHIVYLGGLAIDPSFLGKGPGFKMLQEIIALSYEMGFLRIELSLADNNQKAISLYKKASFQKKGRS